MYAIDTNLLVYAHNEDSKFHEQSSKFIEKVMNERDKSGHLSVCIPSQVLMEFVNVITRQSLEKPLSLSAAIEVLEDYLSSKVKIVHQKETQIQTFLDLLASVTTRKKIFDVVLAATLRDNGITGLYTLNVDDFKEFGFLNIINPLEIRRN